MGIILTTLISLLLFDEIRVEPVEANWADVAPRFDSSWLLPMPQLRQAIPKSAFFDLEACLPRLVGKASIENSPDSGEGMAASEASLWEGLLGDALKRSGSWSTELPETLPSPLKKNDLAQLLESSVLFDADWDPDENLDRDGILMASAWDLEVVPSPPWNQSNGSLRSLVQGAVIIRADIVTIKTIENDYRTHWERSGNSYLELAPLRKSYFRGRLPDSSPFTLQQLFSRVDLPFPFTQYQFVLNILNRIDADGHLVCDVYSTSSDFHWLAGRDQYWPIFDRQGQWQGTLLIKVFGFDLDGVPDSKSDVEAALRSSLGHTKRDAERRFAASNREPVIETNKIPNFEFVGTSKP